MEYSILSKDDMKKLKKTKLGGSDGILYLNASSQSLFKLLNPFKYSGGIESKKRLLSFLMKQKELEQICSIPYELSYVEHLNKIGYWMRYYQSSVKLNDWTKQNRHDYRKVITMYQKISEILKRLHEEYGIIVSDCYYNNILIVEDKYPILVDVDSFSKGRIKGHNVSSILFDYSYNLRLTGKERAIYLQLSKDADNSALWLMFFESFLKYPVRTLRFYRLPDFLKKQGNVDSAVLDISTQISSPVLTDIPYFHEVVPQLTLKKNVD